MTEPRFSDEEIECIVKYGDYFGDEVDLALEVQASRKKLADIRELHFDVPLTSGEHICLLCSEPWPCGTTESLAATP